jgi:hypothetical protein
LTLVAGKITLNTAARVRTCRRRNPFLPSGMNLRDHPKTRFPLFLHA